MQTCWSSFPPFTRVACRSNACAILKHVSDWYDVPFFKKCISETWRQISAEQTLSYRGQTNVYLTRCIWRNSWLLFLKKFLSHFWTLQLAYGFSMTKFVQCQSETCQDGTCFWTTRNTRIVIHTEHQSWCWTMLGNLWRIFYKSQTCQMGWTTLTTDQF